jgi:hypothetical protein
LRSKNFAEVIIRNPFKREGKAKKRKGWNGIGGVGTGKARDRNRRRRDDAIRQ